DLYRNDALIKGEMRLSGKPARLESIPCPLLAVSFEHDNIVPWQSAALVVDHVSSADKTHVKLPGGHVGAVVSKSAAKGLWPMLSNFFVTHDEAKSRTADEAPKAERKESRAKER